MSDELKVKDKIFMYDIIDMLKEAASMNDLCVKVIIWGDTIVADRTMGKAGGSESTAISIGICFGICLGAVLGIAFGNIPLGMCLGISIGCAIGAEYYGSAHFKKFDVGNKENCSEND